MIDLIRIKKWIIIKLVKVVKKVKGLNLYKV